MSAYTGSHADVHLLQGTRIQLDAYLSPTYSGRQVELRPLTAVREQYGGHASKVAHAPGNT